MTTSTFDIGMFAQASYTPSIIGSYRGNPLIEALPPIASEQELTDLFNRPIEFDPQHRALPTTVRFHLVGQLKYLRKALGRQIRLAMDVDTLLRSGYVARRPRSRDHNATYVRLQNEQLFAIKKTMPVPPAEYSATLLGIPGMGKSETIAHIVEAVPRVIYHPSFDVYQIPYLCVQLPSDGASIKTLARSILAALDRLLPEAQLEKTFCKENTTGETLIAHATRALHRHLVGMLIVEEVQNMCNAPNSYKVLMSTMVQISNVIGMPLFLVGTYAADEMLMRDFRQARRAVGPLSSRWRVLASDPYDVSRSEEWEVLMDALWPLQWVRNPIPCSPEIEAALYSLSAGVTDIAVKLWAAVQLRAMCDGSETITLELLHATSRQDFVAVEPMLDAIRRRDIAALRAFGDVNPITFDQLIARSSNSGEEWMTTPFDASSGASNGVSTEEGLTVDDGIGANGVQEDQVRRSAKTPGAAIDTASGAKKVRNKRTPDPNRVTANGPAYEQGDLRNGLQHPSGVTAHQHLLALGLMADWRSLVS